MKIFAVIFIMLASLHCIADQLEINEIITYQGSADGEKYVAYLNIANESVIGELRVKGKNTVRALEGTATDTSLSLTGVMPEDKIILNGSIPPKNIHGSWEYQGNIIDICLEVQSKSYNNIIDNLDIQRADGESRTLSIQFKDGNHQNLEIFTLMESTAITFEDFTFDGYPDMRVLELAAGGNSSFLFFEYDKNIGGFLPSSSEVTYATNPMVVYEDKLIFAISRDGCCSYQVTKLSSDEVRTASFDYKSESGSEKIKKQETGEVFELEINKDYFEREYLNYLQSHH